MHHQTVSFKGKQLEVDMEAFLSQHDVVYLTPAKDGYDGFPLGNGDLGAMAWTPPDRIHFQINKCNTWDDAPPGHFKAWDDEMEERWTNQRSCSELRIIPGLPVFDWMYLKDFEGRLSLADARAQWSADGPLGKIKCSAFVSGNPKVLVIRYQDDLSEPVTRRVELARLGSRVFGHWYSLMRRNSFLGPEGTKAGCCKDEIWIEQPTRNLKFATVCKLVGIEATPKLYHSRAAGFEIKGGKSCAFTLYLTVVTSEEAKNPLDSARKTVRKAEEEGKEKIFKRHKKYWFNFWSKSFINFSEDYLENLWYINVYQIGSSSRGAYPPHFMGGLWSWNRDVKCWNHHYHWNQQQYTWPLHTSGHPELILPYAKWRLEGLPQAVKDAKDVYGCSGACYSDVTNRHGYQVISSGDVKYNLTPGAQIAMDLWRHYQYTLDKKFLNKCTYPIMREVVRFYLDYLVLGKDNHYHIPKALPLEGTQLCEDTTPDLSCIRQTFPAFIEASKKLNHDVKLRQECKKVLKRLANYITLDLPEGVKPLGTVPPGKKIVGVGRRLKDGKALHFWMRYTEKGIRVFTNASCLPIFPAGLVGLDQKGTKEFTLWERTLRCFPPKSFHGHDVFLIAEARMGLKDLLGPSLKKWPGWYQLYSQGLFREEPRFGRNPVQHLYPTKTNRVRVVDTSPEEYIDLPMAPFAHVALEPGSILETAINEMLLQSYSGKIRVFPSIPGKWEGCFKLHAIGGFVVTSEFSKGEIKYIAIESKLGELCCIVNPWDKKTKVRVKDITKGKEIISPTISEEFRFDTKKGHTYIIEREKQPLSGFKQVTLSGKPNQGPKKLGQATLGKSRQF